MVTRTIATHKSHHHRAIAVLVSYVLVLQVLFSGAAQLRVLLSETPSLCTLLGLAKDSDTPTKHSAGLCVIHCTGHATQDPSVLAIIAIALLVLSMFGATVVRPQSFDQAFVPAFQGRAPPR